MLGWRASLLAFLLFSLSLVVAVPPAAPHCYVTKAPLAPWRRFTNRIIAKIWGIAEDQSPINLSGNGANGSRNGHSGRLSARYGQDIVLRFNITTATEARAIAEASEDLYLDVWEFNDNWVDIRLAKDVVPSLLGLLPASLQHAHAPLMPQSGLAEVIDRSLPSTEPISLKPSLSLNNSFSPALERGSKDLFFSDYQPLSVITPWMHLMESMFTTHVRLINIGISWEGRDIPALRVGVHPTNNDQPSSPRKTIIVSGGIHAREWISTSTVLYVANRLITSYGRENAWTSLLEAFDWIFIPTLNPDGYVYTWETDRLWRKNRQPTSLRFCHGIDLDRSFGFQWDGDASGGGGNPCSESFAGEEPWQAVEAKRFADWARNETENNNVEFVALLDLHSYSQQVLYPYSYSCLASPPTLEDLEELAMGLAKAMRVSSHGHHYKTTSACEGNVNFNTAAGKGRLNKQRLPRIEMGGGSALDWFYHELRIKYAYQIKLRDQGSYGFLLPKENIVPQGKEMLSAVSFLGKYLLGGFGLEAASEMDTHEEKEQKKEVPLKELSTDDDFVGVEHPELGTLSNDVKISEEVEWELKRRRRR